ncbi:MAG TPA: penicillin-binding protein, partial [Micromonosporaceae bacterium]|nr:penicillin-binding protein [Micromonosporaceae bacterium]
EAVDPAGSVLSAATFDEMRWPHAVSEDALWNSGFGLGLILVPRGERVVHVGHDGAMPGFLAGAYGRRGGTGLPRALGVAVLGSSGTAAAMLDLPHQLLAAAVEHDPADIAPWRIGEAAPEALRSVLGLWWSEGSGFVFSWKDGALRAAAADDARGRPPSVFAPVADDLYRVESGREAGELLRIVRDPDTGAVSRMYLATYLLTRTQQTFEGLAASGG